jgi:WD domain, G-beta repeat
MPRFRLALPAPIWCVAGLIWALPAGAAPEADTLPTGAVLRVGTPHIRRGEAVLAVAFLADGNTLAIGAVTTEGANGQASFLLRFWDLAKEREREQKVVSRGEVSRASFCPGGQTLASAAKGGTVSLWNSGSEKTPEQRERMQCEATCIVVSPSGKVAAFAGDDGVVRLWNAGSDHPVRSLSVDTGHTSALAFSPEGKTLVTGSSGGLVRFWCVESESEGAAWTGYHAGAVSALAFSPDGKLLVSGGADKMVRVWDVAGRDLCQVWEQSSEVAALSFAPDGRTVACGHKDGTVHLWEVATGKERCRFGGHKQAVTCVAFSPDGRNLASGSLDATALVWGVLNPLSRERLSAEELTVELLDRAWADLAKPEAAAAYRAVAALAHAPERVLPLLSERMRPQTERLARVTQLIGELGDDRFRVRENASSELAKLDGAAADVLLRKALAEAASAEVRRRLERILDSRRGVVTERETLRVLRVVEVLEHIGSPESKTYLEQLATGSPLFRGTDEAKAALVRLAGRQRRAP